MIELPLEERETRDRWRLFFKPFFCVLIAWVVCLILSCQTVISGHGKTHLCLCGVGWEKTWHFSQELLVQWTSGRESSTGPLAVLVVTDHRTSGNFRTCSRLWAMGSLRGGEGEYTVLVSLTWSVTAGFKFGLMFAFIWTHVREA